MQRTSTQPAKAAPFRSPWDPARSQTPRPAPAPRTHYQQWLANALKRNGFGQRDLRMLAEEVGIPFLRFWKIANGDPQISTYGVHPTHADAINIGEALGDRAGSLNAAGYPDVDDDGIPTDPLLQIGIYVDATALGNYCHLPGGASASTNRRRKSDAEMLARTFRILPGGDDVRTLQIIGDCMEPSYQDGDVIFVRPATIVRNGDTVIALLQDGSITCKVFRSAGNTHIHIGWLEPINGEGRIELPNFRVIGVVDGFFRQSQRRH